VTDADIRNEVSKNCEFDTSFTKRWKHLFDVAKEQSVRANDENTLALEWEAVGVEQVRSTMQRNDGLASAGTTLHNENTRK
jgi:hypothetical protein